MYDVILLPTDGSDRADSAADTGIELAQIHDAAVHVICVADEGPLGSIKLPGDAASAEEAIKGKAQEFVEEIADRAREADLDVETATPSGPTADRILDYADEVGADLIVMGTRGRGGIRRAALGSVTDDVIRYGDVQILVEGGGIDLE